MTFSSELRRELAHQGIDARRARRIVAELEDHRACDPDAQLGSPVLIAARFAAELRLTQTRRATYGGFVVLAVTAMSLFAAGAGISLAGGWPTVGGVEATFVIVAGLALILGGQVAFVAGVLALWLFLQSESELQLVQRRMRVALAAAGVAVSGEAAHAVALRSSLPGWWFALAATATVVPAVGLAVSALVLHRAGALTPQAALHSAGVPRWFVFGTGVFVVAAMTASTGHAEGSLVEGLLRGAFEAIAFTCGFLALGRFLGLRASNRHETEPILHR